MSDGIKTPDAEPGPGDTLPGAESGASTPPDPTRVAPAELDDATVALQALEELGTRRRRGSSSARAAAAPSAQPDEAADTPSSPAAGHLPPEPPPVQSPADELPQEQSLDGQEYDYAAVVSPPPPPPAPLQGSYARRRRIAGHSPTGAMIARYSAPVVLLVAVLVVVSLAINAGVFGGKASVKPTPAPTHTVKAKARYYVVKQGDSLSSISLKTGVSMAKIQQLNPTIDPATLRPGQRLKLNKP
jgi:LysM repeat protein